MVLLGAVEGLDSFEKVLAVDGFLFGRGLLLKNSLWLIFLLLLLLLIRVRVATQLVHLALD